MTKTLYEQELVTCRNFEKHYYIFIGKMFLAISANVTKNITKSFLCTLGQLSEPWLLRLFFDNLYTTPIRSFCSLIAYVITQTIYGIIISKTPRIAMYYNKSITVSNISLCLYTMVCFMFTINASCIFTWTSYFSEGSTFFLPQGLHVSQLSLTLSYRYICNDSDTIRTSCSSRLLLVIYFNNMFR